MFISRYGFKQESGAALFGQFKGVSSSIILSDIALLIN